MEQGDSFHQRLVRTAEEAASRHEQMCREREQTLLHLLEQAVLNGGHAEVVGVIKDLPEEDRELLVERFPDLLSRLTATASRARPEGGIDLGAAFRAIELIRQARNGSGQSAVSDPLAVSIGLSDLVKLARNGSITEARGLLAARDKAIAERRGFFALLGLLIRREAWFCWIRLKKGAGAF